MMPIHRRTIRPSVNTIFVTILVLIIPVLVTMLVVGCGGEGMDQSDPDQQIDVPETFTFFGLGAGTRLTKAVREGLVSNIGSEAVEKRGTIDLSVQPVGLLEKRFKRLYTLNRGLNSDLGARVEHDITRLTYRYPRQKDTVFKFIQLIVSNVSARPLYFRIILKKEGSATVDTLREKYGPPEVIDDDPAEAIVLYWEKHNDTLIVSEARDRFGDPEYHLMFYFVNNLDQLLAAEKKAVERREMELEKAGKTAF